MQHQAQGQGSVPLQRCLIPAEYKYYQGLCWIPSLTPVLPFKNQFRSQTFKN